MVLIVIGLGVIASMMGIFNFAHGEFVPLDAYAVYRSAAAGLGGAPPPLQTAGLKVFRHQAVQSEISSMATFAARLKRKASWRFSRRRSRLLQHLLYNS